MADGTLTILMSGARWKKMSDPPSRINGGDTEEFEIKTGKGSDGEYLSSLDTKDTPPLYSVVSSQEQQLEECVQNARGNAQNSPSTTVRAA